MGRFERENISKKVNLVSQIFAVLASFGILVIGLQLFSKTTGFDIFNISYSLSKLFLDESTEGKNNTPKNNELFATKDLNAVSSTISVDGKNKANVLLQNGITLASITPTPSGIINKKEKEKSEEKRTIIEINTLPTNQNLFTPFFESTYAKNLVQNELLTLVKDAKVSKWSLGISISPGTSYRQMKYTNLDEIVTRTVGNTQYGFYQSKAERNKLDKALMKYSLALDIIYRVNKKISIQSGITYLNTGESLLLKEISTEPGSQVHYPGTGAENHYFFEGGPDFESPKETTSEENVRFANNLSFFEIPFVINYKVKDINNITDLQVQAGVSITRLDFANAMVYNFDNDGYYLITGSSPNVFQKYGSNAMIGLIYNKYITNTIQIFANPQFKLGLTNVFNTHYNISQHYYNSGIKMGMKINL